MTPSPPLISLLSTSCISLVIISIFICGLVTSCPLQCQCNSQYYVYCNNVGLGDDHMVDVISHVPTSVISLDLSSNRISHLAGDIFNRLLKLEYLNLAANQLVEVRNDVFSNLTTLRELYLQENKIRTLGLNAFRTLTRLEELNLRENSLTSLPAGVFNQLGQLKRLRLSSNSISQMKARTFTGLNELVLLNLSNNRLKSLNSLTFTGLTSLKKLNLNRNNLAVFHSNAFDGLSNLWELDLSHNAISDMAFLHENDFFATLQQLYMSHNNVNNVPEAAVSCNQNLKTLDLSSNRIHAIANHAFRRLRLDYLKLEKNAIAEITRHMFKDVLRISQLNLSSNQIMDIKTGAFDSFRESIQVLDLRMNSLTYIHPGMFRRMLNIHSLYLGFNAISILEPGSFENMLLLQTLDLSHTKLTSLARSTIAGSENLRHLLLTNTPLAELTEFVFEDSHDRIFIETSSSIQKVSKTSAEVTWPYTKGSQLYWKISVTCVTPEGCPDPPHPPNLKPYVQTLTLSGLTSGHEYFVCINPIFLSPDAVLTQCVYLQTELTLSDGSSATTPGQGRQSKSNGQETFHPVLFPLNQRSSCFVMSVLVCLLLWTKQL